VGGHHRSEDIDCAQRCGLAEVNDPAEHPHASDAMLVMKNIDDLLCKIRTSVIRLSQLSRPQS
jgi:hypothetical protein